MHIRLFPSILPIAAVTVALFGILLPSQLHATQDADPETGIDPASCRVAPYGKVSLCWNADEAIFPRAKQFAMSATPLEGEERERALKIVDAALLRYPPSLLEQSLKAVFVVDTLNFRGISASGTYDGKRVYLANRGVKKGFTDEWISGVFHSEFSSILMWRYSKFFDKAAWQACNSPEFTYGGGGVDAVKNGTARTTPAEEWWKKGFISQYGTASMEEDFNQVVKYMFTHSVSDRPILAVSTQLQQKAVLTKDFYRKLGVDIDALANTNVEPAK
ncbi:hypothetical protein EON83_07225 [bacterium]|nr:MAG: hypothetical protein EON83_07225 [bacterium]